MEREAKVELEAVVFRTTSGAALVVAGRFGASLGVEELDSTLVAGVGTTGGEAALTSSLGSTA